MKIETKVLRDALSLASKFSRRGPVDLMECCLIKPGDGAIVIETTCPDADISISIAAESSAAKPIAVSIEKLLGIVDRATGPAVTLLAKDGFMNISGGGARGKLKVVGHEAYSTQSTDCGEMLITTGPVDLKRAIQEVSWSAQDRLPQPFFAGLTIISGDGEITVTCISPPGLARAVRDAECKTPGKFAILTLRSAVLVSTAMPEASIEIGVRRAVFRSDRITVTTPLLSKGDGEPIKMPAFAPKTACTVKAGAMLTALNVCGVVLGGKGFRPVRMRGGLTEDLKPALVLSADGPDGSVEAEAEVDGEVEPEISCALSLYQALKAFSAMPADAPIKIEDQGAANKPMRLSHGPWSALLMPVKE